MAGSYLAVVVRRWSRNKTKSAVLDVLKKTCNTIVSNQLTKYYRWQFSEYS